MSKRDILGTSKIADDGRASVPAPEDEDLDDEVVELDESFFENAEIRRGGKVIREATGEFIRRGRPPKAEGERKVLVSLRLSPDIVEWFRASGPGWQTRIEEMLRAQMASDPAG